MGGESSLNYLDDTASERLRLARFGTYQVLEKCFEKELKLSLFFIHLGNKYLLNLCYITR